jgi:hypothetical protein
MIDKRKIINDFIEEERRKDAEFWKENKGLREETFKRLEEAERELFPKLIEATPEDYLKWLSGFFENGGKPTHFYDYPMDDFYVAKEDFYCKPLYGASSINIIVPESVKYLGGKTGHNNIYLMDGFQYEGWGLFVPIFSNTKF